MHSLACNSKFLKQSKLSSNAMQDSIFTMPTLPSELIVEILLRVPVKSLLKFRCVSKSWLALISSPEFVKNHLTVSALNKDYTHHRVVLTHIGDWSTICASQIILREYSLSSLRNDSVLEAFDLDYPMNIPPIGASILGSINGLICLAINYDNLFIWNPSIRKFKNLPDSGLKLKVRDGYDSNPTSVIYGFGYDESIDDYKVVGVLSVERNHNFHHLEVSIYSLKSDSWRCKDEIPDGVRLMKPCKFLNGKLHWTVLVNGGFYENKNIISMDLTDEKWGMLEQPLYTEGDFFVNLEVVGTDLSIFCKYTRSHADVWVMRDYGVKESWTKTYIVKYPDNMFFSFISQKLCISNKGEILLVPGLTLNAYNPEDEPIKYPNITNFGTCIDMNIYIESLVCPRLQNEQSAEQE